MKFVLNSILAFFIMTSMSSCSDAELKNDMVRFDRVFIPAWYFAYAGDLPGAEKAIIPLNREWNKFKNKHADRLFASGDWTESLRLIGAWLEEAECAVKDGDLQRATVQLDHARYEIMDLRYLYDIDDYYLDAVWNLETTISIAIETSEDLKLKLLEWEEYRDLSKGVESAWQKLLKIKIDPKTYDMNKAEVLMFARRKADLNKAVNDYLHAVETADGEKFEAAAKNMEPAYLNFITSFGDFKNLRTYLALNP